MNSETMNTTLKSLKLFGMADTIANMTERDVRSINNQMKAAKFPAYRDLSGFEFSDSQVDEALVRSLQRCEFMDDAQNVVFVGGSGYGQNSSSERHWGAGDTTSSTASALFIGH